MKRFLAGLLAMIIAVAGIEPVALKAAEKEGNVFSVGNHEKLEMMENMLVEADLFDTKSYEVTKGSVTVLDGEEDIAPPMQRASTIASGTCGSNARWTLDSDYTLTISGSGAMTDYSHFNEQPWYSYASNIKSIVVENGITRIGSCAFTNFQNVINIAYYNTVTEIGSFAFAYTFPGLDGTFSIGENVEVIEPYAFSGNIETSYTVKSGNKYYCAEGGNIYDINKTGLVQAGTLTDTSISLPSTVELVWYGSLLYGAYTSFDNSNIQMVYPEAFLSCVHLKTVKLNSVVEIGASAFAGCESLQSFTFPSSTTSIYSQVFMECTNLSSITFKGNAPTFGDDVFYNVVATANYDSSKSGWTSSVRKNYGGTITWKDVNQGSKKNQTITAKNISKTVSSSERKIAINATTNGNGKLSYKSSNSKIKIKSGKVVIPKNFIGKATITITAASTSKYSKATKKITVTVKPVKATVNSVKNNKKGLITIKIKKNIGSVKYQIQVAKDSGFENKISKNKSYNSDGYTVSGLEKGKTYYVRVRGYKKVNDVTYYGKWSDVKKIKISK